MVIVNDTIDTFEFIQTYFPDFKNKPFYNEYVHTHSLMHAIYMHALPCLQ